jgi:hypothetical protein
MPVACSDAVDNIKTVIRHQQPDVDNMIVLTCEMTAVTDKM